MKEQRVVTRGDVTRAVWSCSLRWERVDCGYFWKIKSQQRGKMMDEGRGEGSQEVAGEVHHGPERYTVS